MELTLKQVIGLANRAYPKKSSIGVPPQAAYVKGFCAAMRLNKLPPPKGDGEEFLEAVAKGLRNLWPSGEKDGKWPWRDSVANIRKRLEFVWQQYELGDGYTVDDCLRAGRRYLAQFESSTKYMMLLKYFVFKQEKMVASDGRISYTYKSAFADFLTADENGIPDGGESVAVNSFEGELV